MKLFIRRTATMAVIFFLLSVAAGSCAFSPDTGENGAGREPGGTPAGVTEPPADETPLPDVLAREPNSAKSTRKQAVEIIEAHKKKSLEYKPLSDPDNKYALDRVTGVHMIEMLTGEYSMNQTKSRYGVGGTDLGIIWGTDEKLFIAFGDTFLNEPQSDEWRSNVLAYTTDLDYTDGIMFDGMIERKPGMAKELLRGRKVDNIEVTKIPTGAFNVGDTHYMAFMSVKHWGAAGEWICNYGGFAKSTDEGETWTILEDLQWPGDSCFCQMVPVVVDDYLYIAGISGGRNGSAKMMRVKLEDFENRDAYEYLIGLKDDDSPIFEKGEENIYTSHNLLPKPVGEMSIMFNEYLGEWMVTYLYSENLVLRVAKNIWGPYSKVVTIAEQKDLPGLYGAFMHPAYVTDGGRKVGFLMSLWTPVYNVAVMEMELVKKD
ncbi:MAG TPA: DUF4185 domain-containing protein [Clostridiales bacterium]|jgi:hypothetical protein|nr:DUF4185 domain-containing protein [Clostridiales bacterium]